MIEEKRSIPLTIEHVARDGHHTLRLEGELDLSSAAELAGAVPRCCDSGTSKLSIDLHGVTFMDSTGLRALLAAAETCEGRDCELEVLHASGAVQRLLQITGAIDVLPIAGLDRRAGDATRQSWNAADGRTDAAR